MQEQDKLNQQLRDALVAIKKLKSDLAEERAKDKEPIAIIGMACRFPGGANTLDQYWQLIANGVDAITDIPKDRFDAASLYDPDPYAIGKINVKQGGFLDDIDKFDPTFFDISPAELESVDPQQRLFLEVTHEALENAGINVKSLIDSDTGVYVGLAGNDYTERHFRSGDPAKVNPHSYIGTAICANSGRISYLMGFQGPSISIDTACSSSLVATHLAVQALRNRECSLAVAGGVNAILEPELTIYFSTLNGLSEDSRCKAFSNDANGFVRSEGCGIVVLKRLSDALRDKDNIVAVIRGTAVNQDGKSNGFTAPSVKAQTKLLQQALKNASLQPDQIDYIEAHGTGTKIGDPIEVEAIANVFKKAKTKDKPLLLGSVKSNIGHTEGAAGVASIIKTVLSLQHGLLPKVLHLATPNQLVDWNNLPIKALDSNFTWTEQERIAGVSGFGVTGTNAHVILSNAPKAETDIAPNVSDIFVLPLSAKTEEALKALADKYATFIEQSPEKLEEICAMAALRRAHWEVREVFVSRTKEHIVEQLRDFSQYGEDTEGKKVFDADDDINNIFIFPGQGAQWVGMGKALAARETVFREALETCNVVFKAHVSWDIFEEINKPETQSRLEEIDVIQPLLVAIGIGLARLWESKGIRPDIVIGHSLGEVAAAHIAGMISLEDAAKIICTRSRLMKETSGQGAMGVTDLTEEEAKEYLKGIEDKLSVAVVNSPNSIVLSGDPACLDTVLARLESEGRFNKKIKVDVASHSPNMDSIKPKLKETLSDIQPKNAEVRMYSTALNKWVEGSELTAGYWENNLRNPVQYGAAVMAALESGSALFIEMSPHPLLIAPTQENIDNTGKKGKVLPSFFREKDECVDFLSNFGAVYQSGIDVDWKNIYHQGKFVMLPNYAWQKERFWLEKPKRNLPVGGFDASGKQYRVNWKPYTLPERVEAGELLVIGAGNLADKVSEHFGKYEMITKVRPKEEIPAGDYNHLVFCSAVIGHQETEKAVEEDMLMLQSVLKHFNQAGISMPQWTILTCGAQAVKDGERITNLFSSLLLGMARTLENEHPETGVVRIDLSSDFEESDLQTLETIFGADNGAVKEIAIRRESAFTPVLQAAQAIDAAPMMFTPGKTYIVTGGCSGLGLVFAEWMTTRGADRLALVSRSGSRPETEVVISRMKASGVQVDVMKADVGDATDVSKLIGEIEKSSSLGGIVHAAGILDDASLLQLTSSQINNVLKAKVNGSWNLHEVTKDKNIGTFILFSSFASLLGLAGQGNYVAANTYLDQLALYRRSLNLPALSINWGNIGEVGLAAADAVRGERLKEQGMGTFLPKDLPTLLNASMGTTDPQLALADIDFEKWAIANPGAAVNYFYSEQILGFTGIAKSSTTNSNGKPFGANTYAAALKAVKEIIRGHVSSITKMPPPKIKDDATFKSMGIDSLMALQLKNKLQTSFTLNMAVSSIWTYPSVEKFADFVSLELKLQDKYAGPVIETPEEKAESTDTGKIEREVEELSMEELMRQLDEKSR